MDTFEHANTVDTPLRSMCGLRESWPAPQVFQSARHRHAPRHLQPIGFTMLFEAMWIERPDTAVRPTARSANVRWERAWRDAPASGKILDPDHAALERVDDNLRAVAEAELVQHARH